MSFRIKENFWSWGNKFAITDADGRLRYYVAGRAFSWGDKLSFQDASGNELAFISQKLLSRKPRYQIIVDGNIFAEVVKEWTWFNKKFTLDLPGPNDYTINGSFWAHEFTFQREGRPLRRPAKNFGLGRIATVWSLLRVRMKSWCFALASLSIKCCTMNQVERTPTSIHDETIGVRIPFALHR